MTTEDRYIALRQSGRTSMEAAREVGASNGWRRLLEGRYAATLRPSSPDSSVPKFAHHERAVDALFAESRRLGFPACAEAFVGGRRVLTPKIIWPARASA